MSKSYSVLIHEQAPFLKNGAYNLNVCYIYDIYFRCRPVKFFLYMKCKGESRTTSPINPNVGINWESQNEFEAIANCINILDDKTGTHCPCLLEDVRRSTRVCDRLKHIDLVGSLGTPHDIPVEEEALVTVQTMLELTIKPVMFTTHDGTESNEILNYCADITGGMELLAEKPVALELTDPISLLSMDKELCQRLRYTDRRSLPVVCYPALMPGHSAGALAQSFADQGLVGVLGNLVHLFSYFFGQRRRSKVFFHVTILFNGTLIKIFATLGFPVID